MELLQSTRKIQEELFKKASTKETLFYRFLYKDTTVPIIRYEDLKSNIEKVCYFAFVKKEKESVMKPFIEDIVKSDIKGMTYKKNFIDLLAIFLLQPEFENDNLTKYYQNTCVEEKVILEYLFPDIFRSDRVSLGSFSIDELPMELEMCNDLTKLFYVKQKILSLFDLNIGVLKDKHFKVLLGLFSMYMKILRVVIFIVFFISFVLYGVPLIKLILDKWDEIEKYVNVANWIIPTVIAFILTILGIKINNEGWVKFILVFLLVWDIQKTKDIIKMLEIYKY